MEATYEIKTSQNDLNTVTSYQTETERNFSTDNPKYKHGTYSFKTKEHRDS